MIRTLFLLASMAMATGLSAQKIHWLPQSDTQNYQGVAISPDGKFITGYNAYIPLSEEEYYGTNCGFIWSISKNKGYDVEANPYNGSSMLDISDEGKAVGYALESSGDPQNPLFHAAMLDVADVKIANIDNDNTVAYGISSDGKVIVGYLNDGTSKACVWRDGERILLPLPSPEEAGESAVVSSEARYVSGDGSVVLGKIVCESPIEGSDRTYKAELVTAWRLQSDGSYKYDLVYKQIYDQKSDKSKPFIKAQPMGISDDGNWISLQTRGTYQNEEGLWVLDLVDRMTRMNLSTGQYTTAILDGSNGLEYTYPCRPGGIANDGTMVGAYGLDDSRKAIIWDTDKTLPEFVADKFGFVEINDLFINQAVDITADASRIVGFGKYETGLSRTFWIETGKGTPNGIDSDIADSAEQHVVGVYTTDGVFVSKSGTEGLPHGLYILKTTDGKTVKTKKVMK